MRWMIQWCMWRTTRLCQSWRLLPVRTGVTSCTFTTNRAIQCEPCSCGPQPSRCSIFHPRQGSDAQSREDFRQCALSHAPGSTVSGAIGGWAGSPFLLLAPSPSGMYLYKLAIVRLKPGKLTIGARNASVFWTLEMSAPGSWSSTFCRFMHTVLWTRSPPRTTCAVRARTSGSPGGTGIRGAGSPHVRAVDAPVCSVATHAAGPHVVTAKGHASTAS